MATTYEDVLALLGEVAKAQHEVLEAQRELVEIQKENERKAQEAQRRAEEQRLEDKRRAEEQWLEDKRRAEEAERKFQEERAENERFFKAQRQETDRRFKQVNDQLGKLGNRLGEFVEGLVKPAVVRLFRERGIEVHEVYPEVEVSRADGGIEIDLLVVNLYPFEATVAKPNCALADAIENIDIGGPAMLRAAAKNHAAVTVITDAGDYRRVLDEMQANGGAVSAATRFDLAVKVF